DIKKKYNSRCQTLLVDRAKISHGDSISLGSPDRRRACLLPYLKSIIRQRGEEADHCRIPPSSRPTNPKPNRPCRNPILDRREMGGKKSATSAENGAASRVGRRAGR